MKLETGRDGTKLEVDIVAILAVVTVMVVAIVNRKVALAAIERARSRRSDARAAPEVNGSEGAIDTPEMPLYRPR